MKNTNHFAANREKILLMTLPYLTPLIPPMGLSCLKGFLQANGYNVKTVDVMSEMEIREICYRYFDTLQGYIPEPKRGFFFNVALDVLFNHFMAHRNYKDEASYIELVKLLVFNNFHVKIDERDIRELNHITETFYSTLETYLTRLFHSEKPTILGLSVYKGTLAASLFTAKLIKKILPGVLVLVGGTIFSQDLFPGTPDFNRFLERTPFVDKIFIGESETLFLKYLKGELPGDQKVYTLKDIGDMLLDLNTVPLPDFSDFNLSSYPLIPAFTSRGCVYKCSFCAETLYWKRYNHKHVRKVVDELEVLYRMYGRRLFILTDCLINPMVTVFSKELIRRDLKLYWDVCIKVDNDVCNRDFTTLWRRGGFYRARLGIESGSQHLLDIIEKRIKVSQIKTALQSLAYAGVKTTTYWIAGHPGETETDFQDTLDLVEELQDSIYDAECNPFRFFQTGQVHGDKWAKKGYRSLYPEDAADMLYTLTYSLNEDPPREVIYDRLRRFKEHCKKLGIPNPYSVKEIADADQRWKKLHKNAVPSLLEMTGNTLDLEKDRDINCLQNAQNIDIEEDDVDFCF